MVQQNANAAALIQSEEEISTTKTYNMKVIIGSE